MPKKSEMVFSDFSLQAIGYQKLGMEKSENYTAQKFYFLFWFSIGNQRPEWERRLRGKETHDIANAQNCCPVLLKNDEIEKNDKFSYIQFSAEQVPRTNFLNKSSFAPVENYSKRFSHKNVKTHCTELKNAAKSSFKPAVYG